MEKINKQNPNGTLNAEYVKSLFEELPPYERDGLINELVEKYNLKSEQEAYDTEPTAEDLVSMFTASSILACLDRDDILMYVEELYSKEEIKEYFDIE